MKKKLCLLCMLALLTAGCGKIPKLSNGDDAVVTYENGHMISANDLYEKMKNTFALESLITLSDTYVFETEFEDYVEEAKEYADAFVKAYIEQYEGEDKFLQAVQEAGYLSIDAYKEVIYLNYLQSHAIEEYAKAQIKDEEIEKYYNDVVKGDIELSHILITPTVKDGMSDEEKKTAENEAKKQVEELITKLKASEDAKKTFGELAKEHSKDSSTSSKGGSLGKITYGDLSEEYDELLDAAYKLNNGEFSTSVITTELGYHIILKTDSHEKDTLDNLKDEIREKLAEKLINSQKDIAVKSLQHYRKKYGMEIQDSELAKHYSTYMQNLITSANSSSTTK